MRLEVDRSESSAEIIELVSNATNPVEQNAGVVKKAKRLNQVVVLTGRKSGHMWGDNFASP